MQEIEKQEHFLRNCLVEELAKIPNFHIYNMHATTGIVTFNVDFISAQDIAFYLNSKEIAVRVGDHCANLLVNLIGTSETVRVSLSFYNTTHEIDKFISTCKE